MTTATIEQRVDILEPRVKDLEVNVHRLDQLDMQELLARIDDVGKNNNVRFQKLEDLIGNMNVRFDNIDKRMDTMEKGLNSKIDGLDMKIDGVNKKVEGLDMKVEGLDMKVDGIHTSLSSQVASIKWFFMASIASMAVLGTYLTVIIK